jgi:uncharacterized protein
MHSVLITGGTGLIGKRLTSMLIEKGYQVTILTRSVAGKTNTDVIKYAAWDVKNGTIDIAAMQSADFIIHLAGAAVVEKRWTTAYKKEIVDSRVNSSKLIAETLRLHANKVKAIISASAIGWYGADKEPGKKFIEINKPAEDFLGKTCVAWEQSVSLAEPAVRVCKLRTGIVLSNNGGALAEFIKPVKFGIAAILASGKQAISWIHLDDLCRMYIHAMENNSMQGSFNAVANEPVSNKELTLMLAQKIKGKYFIPIHVPATVLKLVLGESSIEVLKSTAVSNEKIKATGFTLLYPSIEAALNELTG